MSNLQPKATPETEREQLVFAPTAALETEGEQVEFAAEVKQVVLGSKATLETEGEKNVFGSKATRETEGEHVKSAAEVEQIGFGPKATIQKFQQLKAAEDDTFEIESVDAHPGTTERNDKNGNDDLKEEERTPLDGHNFAMAPVRKAIIMIALVTVQFTFHLVMAGLIDSVATEKTGFLRGTIHVVVVGWPWGLQATLSNFFLQRNIRIVEAILSPLAFGACCTLVALLPIDPPTGFITTAMVGVLLHAAIVFTIIFLEMWKSGWKKLDAIKALIYFLFNFSLPWVSLINGVAAMILWPMALSTEYVKEVSGILLSLDMLLTETFCVQCAGLLQNKLGHWLPSKNRQMASWTIMLVHALNEAYKICILLYGAIMNPSDTQWLVSMMFSFVLNVVQRTYWSRFIMFRRFGVGFPTCIAYMHNHVKMAFGYPRFGGICTILLSRLLLNGKGQFFFNHAVLAVIMASFACEVAEDTACVMFPKWGLAPNWKGVGVEKHLRELPQGSFNRRFKVDETGMLIMDVPILPFESSLLIVAIANATVFLCYTGLITLVSMPFILGVCEHVPLFNLNTGFSVLIENGALFWPLRNESACPIDKDYR